MSSGDVFFYNCSCDPRSPTTDCQPDKCMPFFATFFVPQAILLFALIVFISAVEFAYPKKSPLWRIILGCGIIAQFAKVLRTALLLNPAHRTDMDTFLSFLYNSHLCWGSFSFVSLLFFWARLYHDLVPSKKMFGKLMPSYIVVLILLCFFWYAQVALGSISSTIEIGNACIYATGIGTFAMATAYIVYGCLIWTSFLREEPKESLFFKMFISAFGASIFIILVDVFLFAFNLSDFNTTDDFIVKHTIYETLYILLFLSFTSGFVAHFFQHWRSSFRNIRPVTSSIGSPTQSQTAWPSTSKGSGSSGGSSTASTETV